MTSKDGNCIRCGRKLKDPASVERGFGKICYVKYLKEKYPVKKVLIERVKVDENT